MGLELLDLLDDAQGQNARGTSASIDESTLELFGRRASRHRSSKRRAKAGTWSAVSLSPAAAAWPPKAIRPSEQSLIASYRLKPGIDRAEPCEISSPGQ